MVFCSNIDLNHSDKNDLMMHNGINYYMKWGDDRVSEVPLYMVFCSNIDLNHSDKNDLMMHNRINYYMKWGDDHGA